MEGVLTAKIANKNLFFLLYFLYIKGLNIEMAAITKETYENNGIEVITDKIGESWLNESQIQKQLRLKNLPALTNKYDEEYKKCRYELNESTNQPHRRFIHVDLAFKVIKNVKQMNHAVLKKI